jgi:nucleoid DNA-binding protein
VSRHRKRPNAKTQRGKGAKKRKRLAQSRTLAQRMAINAGISVSESAGREDLLVGIMREAVLCGDGLQFNGFGRMDVVKRSAKAWDPKRRKLIKRKRRKVVRFRGTMI